MALNYKPLSVAVFSFFASICMICLSAASKNGGVTVDLIHRDSPRSPFYNPSHTRFERLRRSFNRSFVRYSSMKSTLSSESIVAPITSGGGEYLITISIGTPPVQVVAIADTGSDLTWTQCQPCTQCFKQNAPLFDPRKSSSYRKVSCSSEQCQSLGSGSWGCDDSNGCRYQVSYGDNSQSNGDLATETFTFQDRSEFPKVAFGCGYQNNGTFSEETSGIVGLGGGAVSIVNQMDRSVGGRFSYCLTSLNSNASGKISFGSDAAVTGPNVLSTPILKQSVDTFYYLTLESVSIGNKRLGYNSIPNSNSKQAAEGNIIIDSGTTLTFLPSSLYNDLESELVKAVDGNRVSDPQGSFQLCYELPSNGQLDAPPITAHFTGADWKLPQESIFLEVQQGIACLTLVPSESLAIFGNLHQVNYRVGYDLQNQKLNFLPTDCSSDGVAV